MTYRVQNFKTTSPATHVGYIRPTSEMQGENRLAVLAIARYSHDKNLPRSEFDDLINMMGLQESL